MAKEALMVEETEELEELEVPTGGIGDFVMEDDELEEVYGDDSETDAKEEFGDNGIAQFPALAERMAKYGRNEDNMLAHVAEGELVIPAQFLEDEVMKQRIYDILTEAGVEDPEAYVVGAEANDLNPTTGLPEFFLKKLFKFKCLIFLFCLSKFPFVTKNRVFCLLKSIINQMQFCSFIPAT